MEIIKRGINTIREYDNNPRSNDAAVSFVAESIREFGFKVPIIIDAAGVVIAGHTRLRAAWLLGMREVPCIVADDMTEDQIRAFRLADNKVAEFSRWDSAALKEELDALANMGMAAFGFNLDPDEETETAPEAFQEFDESIETKHKCPACGFEWS